MQGCLKSFTWGMEAIVGIVGKLCVRKKSSFKNSLPKIILPFCADSSFASSLLLLEVVWNYFGVIK